MQYMEPDEALGIRLKRSARCGGFLLIGMFMYLLLVASVWAGERQPIYYNDGDGFKSVAPALEYFEDVGGMLPLSSILETDIQNSFKANLGPVLNFGVSESAFWLKITVKDNRASSWSDNPLLLELENSSPDQVHFYRPNEDGTFDKLEAGTLYPFKQREYKYRNIAFRLPESKTTEKTVYLRIKSLTPLVVPVNIVPKNILLDGGNLETIGLAAFFGAMLILLFYNLFLFISMKIRAYGWYVVYLGFFILTMFFYSGYGAQYFDAWYEKNNNTLVYVFSTLAYTFAAVFSIQFLNLQRYSRFFAKFCNVLIALTLLKGGYEYFWDTPVPVLQNMVRFGWPALFICMGGYCARRGSRIARLYLIAWSGLCGSILLFSLWLVGLVNSGGWVIYAIYYGSMFEVLTLSLALAERYNIAEKEKLAIQKVLRENLEKTNQLLRENNRIKEEFLSTISHELRTPMNGVLGALSVMQHEEDFSVGGQSMMQVAFESADRMMSLVDGIINFTELHSGQMKKIDEEFDPYVDIQDLCKTFIYQAEKKSLTFVANYRALKSLKILADRYDILRVLNIVLDNAIKFTDQGVVQLNADFLEREGEKARLHFEISDTGIGIPVDKKSMIYEAFSQVDQSSARAHGGLGLGLAACSQILQLLEGEIEVRDNIPNGTTVEILVPVENFKWLDANHGCATTEQEIDEKLKNGRILVVEDNPSNLLVTKAIVKRMGLEVFEAENGREALDFLDHERVDLILMDCQMPVLDGYQTTQAIRLSDDERKDIPILAVTANVTTEDRRKCIVAGMDDHISKPINMNILKTKIDYWLTAGRS